MNYPLISEYTQAILSAEDNFDELSYLRPVLDEFGMPIMSSGNFAVVYKMQDSRDGKFYAVKCYTRDQSGREKAYEKISSYLKDKTSKYLIPVSYHKYELFVDSNQTDETEFPILLMEWIEGLTLDQYIKKFNGNSFVLYELCYNFRIMAKWLKEQYFAHGDLKPDNILIRETGDIVLIDYDGMFVPSMDNEDARENGTPDYRHPFMHYAFNRDIDDFALAVIALSLKVISISYGVQSKFANGTGLLFSGNDYVDIGNSKLFSFVRSLLHSEPQLVLYYNTFLKCLYRNVLNSSDFDFIEEKPLSSLLKVWADGISTPLTSDRIKKGVLAPNGLIYNKDKTLVIGFNTEQEYNGEEIYIEEGTIGICENAFDSYKMNKIKLHFPSSLRYFNKKSLNYKYSTLSWDCPWFTYVGGCILTKDKTECILVHLQDFTFDDNISILSPFLFENLQFNDTWPKNLKIIRHNAFYDTNTPEELYIPEGVKSIEMAAFRCCSSKIVYIPSSLINLGPWSFQLCKNLEKVVFHSDCKLTEIKESTFCNDKCLKDIKFCDSISKIGKSAFKWCSNIEKISLPFSLNEIGEDAFSFSSFVWGERMETKLREIVFPPNLKVIGPKAFACCRALESVFLNSDIEEIGVYAFANCSKIKEFNYKKIKVIREGALSRFKTGLQIEGNPKNNYNADYCHFDLYISNDISEIEPGAITGCNIVGLDNKNFILTDNCLYSKNFKCLIYCWDNTNNVSIHEGVRDIDSSAFKQKVSSLTLPNSFDEKNINHACFVPVLIVPQFFTSLSSPEGTIILHDKVYIDEDGVIYSIDKKSLKRFPYKLKLESYSVLDGCVRIEDNAFEGIEDYDPEFGMFYIGNNLKELILPESLRSIGALALEGCREITSLTIPENVAEISDGAFNGCHALLEVKLPQSLKSLGENVFPQSIQSISCASPNFYITGRCLLSDQNELLWIPNDITELNLPKTIIYNGIECYSYPTCIVSKDGVLLWTVKDIPTFTFPSNVESIGTHSFIHNKAIKKLVIPEGVCRIEYNAFSCNQSLEDIYLPSSMEYIYSLKTYQGWGRKYIEFYYPKHIHIPKGTKSKFLKLLPGVIESHLIEDYNYGLQ